MTPPSIALRLSGLLLTSAALVGCASQAEFRPVGAELDAPPEQAAAYYDLKADGRLLGDAKVWSRGAYTEERADGEVRRLHVGVRLRNDVDTPLRFDLEETELELRAEERLYVQQTPAEVEGSPEVAPGQLQRLHLRYAIPAEVEVRDLTSFELVWVVDTPAGRLSKATPFRRIHRRGGAYYGPWYYDSWYYDRYYDPYWPYARFGFYGASAVR